MLMPRTRPGAMSPTSCARWPKLAALMDDSEHDVLAYLAFPAQHRTKLHSTNPLERLKSDQGLAEYLERKLPANFHIWIEESCPGRATKQDREEAARSAAPVRHRRE